MCTGYKFMLTFKVHKKFINEFVFINHFESSVNFFHNMATLSYVLNFTIT